MPNENKVTGTDLIHTLPYDVMSQLTNRLDHSGLWLHLIDNMPDITNDDVAGCRKYTDSPSWFLLRIWASKGYSIMDLYNLFALCKMVRCMQIIKPFVDPDLHALENEILTDVLSMSPYSIAQSDLSHLCKPSFNAPAQSSVGTSKERPHDTMGSFAIHAPYAELESGCNHFSKANLLGSGGYGKVYKCDWRHQTVAVKKMLSREDGVTGHNEQLRQSQQELRNLSLFRHDNILELYAYSLDGPEPCLVYKYMPNGSLDGKLHKKVEHPLTWPQRFDILVGTAKAVNYLHTAAQYPRIHGDIKPANILLDRNLEPKLGDFGLCSDASSEHGNSSIASHIKGTIGYLPPEIGIMKSISTTIDTYSFGIVVLEVLTGQRVNSNSRKYKHIAGHVSEEQASVIRSNGGLQSLRDRISDKTVGPPSMTLFKCLLELGLKCASGDGTKIPVRPNFHEILTELEACTVE